ncbi:hypothetical protein GCM10009621_13190 [Corynebacterium felinum]
MFGSLWLSCGNAPSTLQERGFTVGLHTGVNHKRQLPDFATTSLCSLLAYSYENPL